MWEFIKNIFAIYIALGIFILNFIASAGILKFYFDKKLANQKEEADKKITELNGKIERGNYIHKTQFEKEFNIYVELFENVNEYMTIITEYPKEVYDFYKLTSDLNKLINKSYPFCNESIHNKFSSIIKLSQHFYNSYEQDRNLLKKELTLIMKEISYDTKKIINNYIIL